MRQYVQEIAQVLHLMSEQELKDSIEKLCGYLLFKYGEYYIDDFDDDTTPKMTLEQAKVLINAPILKVRSMQEIKDECFGPKKTKFSLRLLWIFIISIVVSIPVGIFLHNSQYQVESQFGFSWLMATLIFFGMWFGISLLIDLFEHHSRVYIHK